MAKFHLPEGSAAKGCIPVDVVAEIEQSLGCSLPDEYRLFLREHGGATFSEDPQGHLPRIMCEANEELPFEDFLTELVGWDDDTFSLKNNVQRNRVPAVLPPVGFFWIGTTAFASLAIELGSPGRGKVYRYDPEEVRSYEPLMPGTSLRERFLGLSEAVGDSFSDFWQRLEYR